MIGNARIQPLTAKAQKPAMKMATIGDMRVEQQMPVYATSTPTDYGINNVRLESETPANGLHYILIIGAVIAGVLIISKQLEDKGL